MERIGGGNLFVVSNKLINVIEFLRIFDIVKLWALWVEKGARKANRLWAEYNTKQKSMEAKSNRWRKYSTEMVKLWNVLYLYKM